MLKIWGSWWKKQAGHMIPQQKSHQMEPIHTLRAVSQLVYDSHLNMNGYSESYQLKETSNVKD